MGASDVGDGHRCRRSRTSWEELEDRADGGGLGGVAKARSTKCALSRRFPPQNHPNFSLISSVRKRLFCSGGRLVLPPELLHNSLRNTCLSTIHPALAVGHLTKCGYPFFR